MGPIFIKEPPNRVDFSNGTGAVIECQARGNPQPDIIWIRADGTAVGDVPGLRQVLPNGNLVFPPFRAEDYRQEVHAQVYICLARNTVGSIHSRDVNVRAVVAQYYDVDVNKEYAIRGNSAVLKCVVPSFVADFVSVLSWHTDQGEEFVRRIGGNADGVDDNYVVHQFYQSEVNNEYVIRGNAAILKCSIPSFVAEFVQIVGWQDDQGNTFNMGAESVVTQYYEAEVVSEYVIRGNAAILKCTIPSFVAEFVSVDSWEGSDGSSYKMSHDYVVTQAYHPEIMTEYVIRGNSAILKCSIPSYVAEFVTVEAWISEDGETYLPRLRTNDSVVAQSYVTEAENEYVIRANSAIMKCKIPSFVSEFIQVDQWVASDGSIYTPGREYAVSQYFEVQVYDVFAIRGNAAIFKCQVPSFVGDYVVVAEWISSNDESFTFDNQSYVVGQRYAVNVMDEHVLRGNAAIIKCHIPSFVAEFVLVDSWLEDDSTEIYPGKDYDGKYLVLPSGELHIKDVGPEDGYKTYQCRTKHRLTGETRLSATKGRLVITEPVGSVRPKLPSLDNLNSLVAPRNGSLTLLCPAQGFPVPSYRPKFSTSENSRTYTNKFNEPLVLFCPAQAFPVPNFRTRRWSSTEIFDERTLAYLHEQAQRAAGALLPGTGVSRSKLQNRLEAPDPSFRITRTLRPLKRCSKVRWFFCVLPKGFLFRCTEPSSNTKPKLATNRKVEFVDGEQGGPNQWLRRPPNSQMRRRNRGTTKAPDTTLLYFARHKGFPFQATEPVSTKIPKFSNDAVMAWYVKTSGHDITLFCPAQGFPVPSYSQSKPLLYFAQLKVFLFPTTEPVSTKIPKFSNDAVLAWYVKTSGHDITLFCPAQGFPVPSYSELKGGWLVKRANTDITLLCPAQGHPIPVFR
ncbi:hypothetical protein TKK_0011721 [Trichogramma kaykai]